MMPKRYCTDNALRSASEHCGGYFCPELAQYERVNEIYSSYKPQTDLATRLLYMGIFLS